MRQSDRGQSARCQVVGGNNVMLVFPCAQCKQSLSVAEAVAGKKVRCPRCQAVVDAPSPSMAPAPAPAAAPSGTHAPQTSSAGGADVSWVEAWKNELQVPQVSMLGQRETTPA